MERKVFPFRGVFYNLEKVKELEKVLCPPYDIISSKEQEDFYKMHPLNIIRIDYGKIFPGDSLKNNRYTRAKRLFQQWLKEKILVQDSSPSFYLLSQKFAYKKEKFVRWGIIGRLKLSQKGNVFSHEKTSSSPKEDRFRLLRAIRANTNPIFAIFEDEDSLVEKLVKPYFPQRPFLKFEFQKIDHCLWRINEPNLIRKIEDVFRGKNIFIADGHHRYEASLLYQNYCRKKNPYHTGREDYNFVMSYFTPLNSKALKILPTHRLLKKIPIDIWEKLGLYFEIKPCSKSYLLDLLDNPCQKGYQFGMYIGKNKYFLLTLKENLKPEELICEDKIIEWKRLETSILQHIIIEKIFEVKDSDFGSIFYTQDLEEAICKVNSKEYKIAFFLKPTNVYEVRNIALAKERMPHKSTYFYPKLPSGLVINLL